MECQCGCGEKVQTASFKSGHDQRLRISLERRVGGIESLRALVEAAERFIEGRIDSKALVESIESILKGTSRDGRS